MQAHGAGAGGFSVVIADHRHGGGEVACLAQSLGRAEEEEVSEVAGQRRGYTDQAPEMETGENRGFPAHPVDDRAGERRPQAVDPGEGGTEKPELHGRKPHFLLEQGEDRKDGLAVGVIEERDPHSMATRCHLYASLPRGVFPLDVRCPSAPRGHACGIPFRLSDDPDSIPRDREMPPHRRYC